MWYHQRSSVKDFITFSGMLKPHWRKYGKPYEVFFENSSLKEIYSKTALVKVLDAPKQEKETKALWTSEKPFIPIVWKPEPWEAAFYCDDENCNDEIFSTYTAFQLAGFKTHLLGEDNSYWSRYTTDRANMPFLESVRRLSRCSYIVCNDSDFYYIALAMGVNGTMLGDKINYFP